MKTLAVSVHNGFLASLAGAAKIKMFHVRGERLLGRSRRFSAEYALCVRKMRGNLSVQSFAEKLTVSPCVIYRAEEGWEPVFGYRTGSKVLWELWCNLENSGCKAARRSKETVSA